MQLVVMLMVASMLADAAPMAKHTVSEVFQSPAYKMSAKAASLYFDAQVQFELVRPWVTVRDLNPTLQRFQFPR